MTITISPIHTVLGNDVQVSVVAGDNETLNAVRFECEGHTTDDALEPPHVAYDRTFQNVTGYTPGNQHTARVTVTDGNGNQKAASKTWLDT